MKKAQRIQHLIETIYQNSQYQPAGEKAMDELCRLGKPGLDAMVRVRKNPPLSSVHGRDLAETIYSVYQMFAEKYSDELIDYMRRGDLPHAEVYSALRNARDEKSIDVLIDGLSDRNMWNRWEALEALFQRHAERSALPIIQRLKDRSSLIKHFVIAEMKCRRWLRTLDALPLLRRLQESESLKHRSPVTWERAGEVALLIEQEHYS